MGAMRRAGIGRLGLLALIGALATLLLLPSLASADYEQVPEHFGASGEAEQLQNALGMAVNASGAGGVAAGSLYVVGRNHRVVRYAPGKEGEEPAFEEAWGWGVGSDEEGAPSSGYERCGPALSTEPALHTYHRCKPANPNAPFGGEEVGHFEALAGVAVDPATGDVYVRNSSFAGSKRKHHLIEVFTATGTPVGEGFGDAGSEGPPPESIAEGPEKVHYAFPTEGAIAVDAAGTVYLNDADYNGVEPRQVRVMSFKPCSPGEYGSYCYAEGKDIRMRPPLLSRIALVGSDRLVVANEEEIREYPLGVENATPLCDMSVSGRLYAMTANQATGEVFYYRFSDKSIHRLGPCDPETGEFGGELQQKMKPVPATGAIYALAVNPTLHWGDLRPEGVLYTVDAEEHAGTPPQLGIGDVLAPAKLLGPAIEAESVANATATSATLRAQIDPQGFAVSYSFQYLLAVTYEAQREAAEGEGKSTEEAEEAAFAGALEAPAGGGTLTSGAIATAAIASLSPDSAYRFRVLAGSHCAGPSAPLCESQGEAAAFATYPTASAPPPDNRAYELVSPARKNGGEVFPADPRVSSCDYECKPPGATNSQIFPMQSAPNGDSVTYMGYAFSSEEGAAVFNSYVSRRGASGWQTQAMSPALLGTSAGRHLTYDPQLGAGTISQASPVLAAGAPEGYADLYLEGEAGPESLTPLLTAPPPNRGAGGLTLEYAGASPDYSCQYFAANDALTAKTVFAPAPPDPTSSGRDLYQWCNGALKLVNVLPGNASVAASSSFASKGPDAHPVSADGSRVFWSASSNVYVREGGEKTLQLAHAGAFLTASADGTQVLFADGCLYSLTSKACADLTQDKKGFLGILGQGEAEGKISRLYFVDSAVLPGSGQNERGQAAEAAKPNLYLYEQGKGTSFITTLLTTDGGGGVEGLEDWAISPAQRTAEASPNGRYLAFASTAPLTGYDNVGCEHEEFDFELAEYVPVLLPCREAFLYDSASGHLTCPSCNPTGEAPLGPSTLRRIGAAGEWQPQSRYLTDSGRLYFDSQDRLSPRDVNGRVEDVYEAEPQGTGSCVRATGCVSLISPGTGAVDSNLLAVDETGANVFFTSREALVPSDSDELVDLYDAREGGGFAGETETQPAECLGEACQPPVSAPNDSTPGSASFEGAGNVHEEPAVRKPRRCAKSKVRRHGRCVARHRKHRRHARRNRRGAR